MACICILAAEFPRSCTSRQGTNHHRAPNCYHHCNPENVALQDCAPSPVAFISILLSIQRLQRITQPHIWCRHMQAVRDVEWRHFMNYNSFMACQELLTRGVGNDKVDATNKPASALHLQRSPRRHSSVCVCVCDLPAGVCWVLRGE
jgi:hypothetical protein